MKQTIRKKDHKKNQQDYQNHIIQMKSQLLNPLKKRDIETSTLGKLQKKKEQIHVI